MLRRTAATVLAVLVLAGCDGSGDDPDPSPSAAPSSDGSASTSGSVSASPTGDPGPVVTCPRATLLDPDPALPDEVPDGATSVRLCDGGDDKVTPPGDALTTAVASVVSAVNAQPLVTRGCVDRRIPEYALAFGYPDGTTFTVAGRFTGCGELLVGSARRAKAGPALHTFVERLLTQRATATPPAPTVDPADLDCAKPREDWTWPLGEPTGLTVAVLCVGQPARPGEARRVTIPRDDLKALVRSMRKDPRPLNEPFACSAFPTVEHWIVGADAWGDPITMTRVCVGLSYGADREWRPRQQAREIIQRLTARAH